MYLTLTNFTQRKRKTFDGNDLLTLSVINIIVYIYSLRKKFYCTYLKITEHDMILSYGKPFNDKMQEEQVCFVGIKILKLAKYLFKRPEGLQLY